MNWSFLNPAVLWALPLALAPVLLHLLLRRPAQAVRFSDLRFLAGVVAKVRPRKRLQSWLILLLRALALVSLFLFFSRPVFHWGPRPGAGDSAAVAVLLDASYSMRAQDSGVSHWDRALRSAEASLRALKEKDRSALLVFSDRVQYASGYLSNRHAELAAEVKDFKPGYRTTHFLEPLQAAYRLLAQSPEANKAILILSDMARHGWNAEPGAKPDASWEPRIKDFDPAVKILYAELPPARGNLAVRNVQPLTDLYSGLLKLQVEVWNPGPESVSDGVVFLEVAGRAGGSSSRQSEAVVGLNPGESRTVSLSASLPEGSSFSGAVGLEADALAADNAYHFSRFSARKVKVLIVEEPAGIAALSGESYYLRQALLSPPSPFEVQTVALSGLARADLGAASAVVLVNPGALDPGLQPVLQHYLARGGSLLLIAGERFARAREPEGPALASLEDILPCGFLDSRRTAGLSLLPNPDAGPEMAGFQTEYDWSMVRVEQMVQPALKEDAEPWLLLSDRTPVLVFSRDRRVAVWAASIDRSWTNLPSKPVFVPLFRLVLSTLAKRDEREQADSLLVGQSFRAQEDPGSRPLRVLSPGGNEIPLKRLHGGSASPPLEEPGIYAVRGGTSDREFSVNVDLSGRESDGAPLSKGELDAYFPSAQKQPLAAGSSYLADFLSALRGRELSRWFLVSALALLGAEMALAARRR